MADHHIARVVAWMTGALLSFSALAVSVRLLSGHLNIFETLTLRAGGGLIILVAIAAASPQARASIRLRFIRLHLFRNIVHFGAQFAWALPITVLPLATVFALEFIAPAWTVILAVWILKEKITASRIGVIVCGLLGVLVILRPGLQTFSPYALLVILATVGYAISFIMTKTLTRIETTYAIIFWMMAMQLPLCFAGSDPFFLGRLAISDIPAAAAIGVSGLASHYCLTNAFRSGDATLVVPMDFLRVPLIAVIGWMFFGEALDIWVFVGVGIIITGILWNLMSEARRSRETPLPIFPD